MEIDSDRESVEGEEHFSSDEDASVDEMPYDEEVFNRDLPRARNNDPEVTLLEGHAHYDVIQNITNDQWEEIGRDISNNTHLEHLTLDDGALNDDNISFLFRGLTSSSSIKFLSLINNDFSTAGVRSMVPFLRNSHTIERVDLARNELQSEGFNILLRALRDSPIEVIWCMRCGIESIEIDIDYFPRHLKMVHLYGNNINADGCREIAKLLQGEDSRLTVLNLNYNNVDDEGVAILVGALQSNTSLKTLQVEGNDNISKEGLSMLLKLVNDISSVKATLHSNHTLETIDVINYISSKEDRVIQRQINMATEINKSHSGNPEAAGREKVIQTQLRITTRAELAELQGVSHSVYSEINPLHLPEVLSLVGRHHGRGELFLALKSSIAGVISVVNERQCILQRLAYYEAKAAEARAELAQFDAVGRDRDAIHVGNEACSNKRPRIDD